MWWVETGAIQESEFHCPLGTHRECQYCLFQKWSMDRTCLKATNTPKWAPLTRADGLLPDPPRCELCDHAALLLPKMVWFTPEGTLPPPISSPPSCTWNVKSYKTNQPVKASPNRAVCNTATVWSRGAMQGEQLLGRRFLRRPESVTQQVTASCAVTFLGRAEIAQLRAGREGRWIYPIPRPTSTFCLQSSTSI